MISNQNQKQSQGLIAFLMRKLDADKILDVRKVRPGVYYVYYKRCENGEDDGGCWFVESYVIIEGKTIEEKVINIG